MLLENLSFKEVEAYLDTKDIILVPVGSVEQHSPYGLIGTDFICAEGIARRTAEKMDIIVAPTLAYGVSPHHMAFAGSVTLKPTTLIQVVGDLVRSLVSHGFRRIVFINGHGGNVDTINTALAEIKMEGLPGYFKLLSWYASARLDDYGEDAFPGQEGCHATPSEVSVTKYLRPDQFDGKADQTGTMASPNHYWPLTAREMRTIFPDGRMDSAPWLASQEHGQKIYELSVAWLQQELLGIMAQKLL
jgi:creatinine amidohydrolase